MVWFLRRMIIVFYRFFHVIISITFQLLFLRDLEKAYGPLRIGIIYLVSGMAGSFTSTVFLPYSAQVLFPHI